MELFAGFLLGFLGSFHCIGMCGPLVLALPQSRRFAAARLLYNLGRVMTYGMFGLVLGFIGSRLNLAGTQQIVSITLGLIVISAVIAPAGLKTKILGSIGFDRFLHILKKLISEFYRSNNLAANLAIGALNGFLPCGFVYMALSGALILGNAIDSAFFMMFFGLGTVPALLLVSAVAKTLSQAIRNRLKRYIPAFSIIIALIFILRGLNLGIPYISPKLQNPAPAAENIECH